LEKQDQKHEAPLNVQLATAFISRDSVPLISDALPFGRLWYLEVPHAIGYAEFYSRSLDAVIRVYDKAGKVIENRTSNRAISKSGAAPVKLKAGAAPPERKIVSVG
jgi:hypothetical protein